ncbi:MAG: aminotransferase DegT [Thermoprotei archaeon]|nr:MAG: aminotransferase DegT [Thermoprotei archaeon]
MNSKKIPVASPEIGEEEKELLLKVLEEGWISGISPYVKEFENLFSSWLGVKHSIAVSSGTAALHLALLALGIGSGDEVIVPDLTFAAPANMVVAVGAKPIFVDITRDYWCIDPEQVRKIITPRTKAIIVVHLYGHPARMNEIMEIAEKNGLYIIEDCAEAHGAEFMGKKVSTFGHVSVFSFYANKVITTGEGGMVVTNEDELADKVRLIREHGMRPRYWHIVLGFNYRMTGLQAALGIAQMKKIDRLIQRKREIAKIYAEVLKDVPGIELHPEMLWAKCIFWLYSIIIDPHKFGTDRDSVMEYLARYGIETRSFFYPLHIMSPYKQYINKNTRYEVSEYLSKHGLNLPSGPKIDDEDVVYVAETIKRLYSELQT